MKGERALLLTRGAHAFFGPTSCPALPLLIGFFRHHLHFPISSPLIAEPLLSQPTAAERLLSQPTAAGPLLACQVCPAKSAFLLHLVNSHTHLTNASSHGLECICCEG